MKKEYSRVVPTPLHKMGRQTLSVNSDPKIRVRDPLGGIVSMQLYPAALAVRRGAHILDDNNKKVLSSPTVICKKRVGDTCTDMPMGQPIDVYDTGVGSYIIRQGTVRSPLVSKSVCREVGACEASELTTVCSSCCNSKISQPVL